MDRSAGRTGRDHARAESVRRRATRRPSRRRRLAVVARLVDAGQNTGSPSPRPAYRCSNERTVVAITVRFRRETREYGFETPIPSPNSERERSRNKPDATIRNSLVAGRSRDGLPVVSRATTLPTICRQKGAQVPESPSTGIVCAVSGGATHPAGAPQSSVSSTTCSRTGDSYAAKRSSRSAGSSVTASSSRWDGSTKPASTCASKKETRPS